MGQPLGLRAAIVALTGAGCAQIAGIDETSAYQPSLVSMTVVRRSIGASVVENPQDLTGRTATYLIPDDTAADGFTRIPAEQSDPNVWSADIKDLAPAVLFDLPDFPEPRLRIWDLGQRAYTLAFGVYEHPSPEPAPTDAMLTVQATLPSAVAAGESFQLYSVGTWNTRAFSGMGEMPALGAMALGPVTFPFASTSKLTGRPHEKITTADTVLVLRYAGSRLSGVLEAAPFDQTGADMIMGAIADAPADQTLSVQIAPSTVAARYAPLRPAMAAPAMSWNLVAAPGAGAVATEGPVLQSGGVAAMDPDTLSVPYANPFASKGWPTVFTWATSSTRTYTPGGGTLAATLRAGLYTRVEPTMDAMVDLSATLPELITVAGVTLSTDGLQIPRSTTGVPVSFTPQGADTIHQVELYELVPNMANTALDYKHVITVSALTPSFVLPPEVFQPGKLYTLRAVTANGSFPNIATGDLATRALPLSQGYLDSGVFTVMP